jgi:hypothetical protein
MEKFLSDYQVLNSIKLPSDRPNPMYRVPVSTVTHNTLPIVVKKADGGKADGDKALARHKPLVVVF